MGATGCGKSSLINLIPRFYDVTSGVVLVDGIDVRKYDQKALREKIAITLQKSELFSMPIWENIAWGRPNASRQEITQAAKIAQRIASVRWVDRIIVLSGGSIEACGTHKELMENCKT